MEIELSKRAREARNRYKREWARANPDKIRAQLIRHWEKVADMYEQQDRAALEGREEPQG